jgi:hypothetical protein
MDLFLALGLALFISLLVAIWWRAQASKHDTSKPSSQIGKPRFETTMNELRDMREALRPSRQTAGQHGKSEAT